MFNVILQVKNDGIHPMALMVGVIGILVLLFVVTASSHQREKLKHMARSAIRKKTVTTGERDHDKGGRLPSFAKTASETGNTRILKRWTSSTNRDINARSDENLTALHYAARGGHGDCMRLLLDAGADPDAQDERRITPLHLASLGGYGLCVKILLDFHADPLTEDLDLQTPLKIAEQSGSVGCARLLQRAMNKASSSDSTSRDKNLTLRSERSGSSNNV